MTKKELLEEVKRLIEESTVMFTFTKDSILESVDSYKKYDLMELHKELVKSAEIEQRRQNEKLRKSN